MAGEFLVAGKKSFVALEKRLVRLGFTYSHNSSRSSHRVYVHDAHPDVVVSMGIDEKAARVLLRKIEKALGELRKTPKRNVAAIKERQAADRERRAIELARLEAERDEILAQRDALLSGAGARLSSEEIRRLERRVHEIEQERRALEGLMVAPVTGLHDPNRSARHLG